MSSSRTTKRGSGNGKRAAVTSGRDIDLHIEPGIAIRRDAGRVWSHVRQKWLPETPEEAVRQAYLCTLVNEYGYAIGQISEEQNVTGRGSAQARADFLVWRSVDDKVNERPAMIVVECKSDNVTIHPRDYAQGDNYARREGAKFFVTHNNRETRFWRVRTDKRPGYLEEIENIPHATATEKEIEDLIARLKTFKEDEFADLLHQCHNVIRNREHLDPAAAFDEIAKVLFIKTWVEREMKGKRQRKNLFTAEWLESQLGDDPLQELFGQTRQGFRADKIFGDRDRLNLKPATGREIVRLLERYNLSDTSEDVKGIAFERFLGKTFRGEIGQFFTPRTIVEFMIRMVEPKEGETICDPASGSGGFLIRFFEIVREKILAEADGAYKRYQDELAQKHLPEARRAALLRKKFEELQSTIDPRNPTSRLGRLASDCIFGTDANERMARTSKMNMIMHGDGHGGVHHHNGFLNVNGIFEGRFDIILTNPPFGSNVEPSDRIGPEDVKVSDEDHRRYLNLFGSAYRTAHERMLKAARDREPIAALFELPSRRGNQLGKVRTEILFIERCLALLRPGGRLGIVLPEGVFNNPSLAYVREFCEDRARLLAVISLPQETFLSAGATVKASLLFLQKFTDEEAREFQRIRKEAQMELRAPTQSLQGSAAGTALGSQTDEQRELEVRERVRKRFHNLVFMYDAQHVGISATGERDTCELYENSQLGLPAGFSAKDTALEQYGAFKRNPDIFRLPDDREA